MTNSVKDQIAALALMRALGEIDAEEFAAAKARLTTHMKTGCAETATVNPTASVVPTPPSQKSDETSERATPLSSTTTDDISTDTQSSKPNNYGAKFVFGLVVSAVLMWTPLFAIGALTLLWTFVYGGVILFNGGNSQSSRKVRKAALKWAAISVVGLMLLSVTVVLTESPERRAERLRIAEIKKSNATLRAKEEADKKAEADEIKAAKNCLSPWDGSLPALTEAVKADLRDPDSFQVINSSAVPRTTPGEYKVSMRYRARNGFGGMNVESVQGVFTSAGCNLVWWDRN